MLDNAGLHTSHVIRRARRDLAAAGVYLYFLPPYAPELNEIEPVFRQVKYQEIPRRRHTTRASLRAAVDTGFNGYGRGLKSKSERNRGEPLRSKGNRPGVSLSTLISEATIMSGHSAKVGRTTGDRIMPSVVGVHGIAQQFKGPNVLRTEWLPALRDGLWTAGIEFKNDNEFVCAFYGELFRQPGTKTVGIPAYDTNDVTDDWEKELLDAWWREAAAVDKGVPSPEAETKAIRTPPFVQRALNALSRSRFFAGIAERALIFVLVSQI